MHSPNHRKGLRWGLGCGFVCSLLFFATCFFASTVPAISEVSLPLAFQPWWKYWGIGVSTFLVTSLVVGVLTALRPSISKNDDQLSKH
jgi:hypothetical protein